MRWLKLTYDFGSVGVWLRFDHFGAYTTSLASDYASVAKQALVYVWTEQEA
jgi:diaminopimelate decarboxylase